MEVRNSYTLYNDSSFTYLLINPFDLSLSAFFPSTALFKTYDAPTLKSRNGNPALMKRWKLDGCSGRMVPTRGFLLLVWTNLYCLRASAAEGGGEIMEDVYNSIQDFSLEGCLDCELLEAEVHVRYLHNRLHAINLQLQFILRLYV